MDQHNVIENVFLSFKYIPGGGLWAILNNEELKVKDFKVWANGTKDLCLYKREGGMTIGYTRDIPKDKLIHEFEGDFISFELCKELDPPFGKYMFVDVNETWLPMLKQLYKDYPTIPYEVWDAYLGGNYGQRGNKNE